MENSVMYRILLTIFLTLVAVSIVAISFTHTGIIQYRLLPSPTTDTADHSTVITQVENKEKKVFVTDHVTKFTRNIDVYYDINFTEMFTEGKKYRFATTRDCQYIAKLQYGTDTQFDSDFVLGIYDRPNGVTAYFTHENVSIGKHKTPVGIMNFGISAYKKLEDGTFYIEMLTYGILNETVKYMYNSGTQAITMDTIVDKNLTPLKDPFPSARMIMVQFPQNEKGTFSAFIIIAGNILYPIQIVGNLGSRSYKVGRHLVAPIPPGNSNIYSKMIHIDYTYTLFIYNSMYHLSNGNRYKKSFSNWKGVLGAARSELTKIAVVQFLDNEGITKYQMIPITLLSMKSYDMTHICSILGGVGCGIYYDRLNYEFIALEIVDETLKIIRFYDRTTANVGGCSIKVKEIQTIDRFKFYPNQNEYSDTVDKLYHADHQHLVKTFVASDKKQLITVFFGPNLNFFVSNI